MRNLTGFLVVNAYLKSEKFDVLHRHLVAAAENTGIALSVVTNEDVLFCTEAPDFVLFWDKDIHAAKGLEARGIPVFNTADAIALCDDKAKTYFRLLGVVPQPATLVAPLSFFDDTDYRRFAKRAAAQLGLPLVYKECCGSFGEQVFLCRTVAEILSHVNGKPFLLQELIAASAGEDVRLEVVDGQCVAAMKRTNPNDFRSNLTNGGTAQPYTPTAAEVQTAVSACEALGLTFGGVDMLNNGMVCEVNSNAHIINIMNVTGVDVAPLIFESILKKL